APPLTPARLLRVEHAVAAALVEDAGWPALLEAVGDGLGWQYGGAWLLQAGAVRCVATWVADPQLMPFAAYSQELVLDVGAGLPGRVEATGEPAWIADVEADDNFPRA